MTPIEKLESSYALNKLKFKNLSLWPILRVPYDTIIRFKQQGNASAKRITFKSKLKSLTYGFRYWFRPYRYMVFSDTEELKLCNNLYRDKTLDYLVSRLGYNDTLRIEHPLPKHLTRKKLAHKNSTSIFPIVVLTKLLGLILNEKIPNIDELEKLNRNLSTSFNYKIEIKKFYLSYKAYIILLRIYKPKAIFVNCHYSYYPLVKASKDLKIQIIEVQHGTIGANHVAYNSQINLDKSFFPNKILLFGRTDKNILQSSTVFPKEGCIVAGSMYLSYINENFKPDASLVSIIKKYKKSIAVTLQWTVEDRLIDFILKAATQAPEFIFILLPRIKDASRYQRFNFPPNVVLDIEHDFYQTVKHVNYHATVYSTCAIEAPSLGIPNILINIDNLSKEFLIRQLPESEVNQYVSSVEEFNIALHKEFCLSNYQIMESNEGNFASSYKENIDGFLTKEIENEI